MDYGDSLKPYSIRNLLQRQVAEQSRVCDVTLKSGRWAKRYHLHVLMESPFFQHAFDIKFHEHHVGAVELHIGSPTTIDMTIMYLYGKCPTLDMNNIAEVLDLAEFLLLPNLKLLCLKQLQRVELSETNVVDILHLCSMYELNIEGVDTFIEQRLLILLKGDHLLSLSPESVAVLFSDQRLSYVPTDLKLFFIYRWIKQRNNTRMDQIRKLMSIIDITRDTIYTEQLIQPKVRCLITFAERNVCSKLLAYCFKSTQWYNVRLASPMEKIMQIGVKVSTDTFLLLNYNHQQKHVIVQDVVEGTTKTIKVKDECNALVGSDIKLIVKKSVSYFASSHTLSFTTRGRTTVLMGTLKCKCGETYLSVLPIFSFKGDFLDWCVSATNMVAILVLTGYYTRKCKLFVYDVPSCMLYNVSEIKTEDRRAKLNAITNGFAVIDSSQIWIIRHQSEETLATRFPVTVVKRPFNVEYKLVDKKCYRYSHRSQTLEETDQNSLLESCAIDWRKIDIPGGLRFDESAFQNLALVGLPMTLLRCHFQCPHCQLLDDVPKS